mmetsp:Transcript_13009/g.23157  ORF Transcript_13009/g.23157 Transcript_13009/m.23157 type:complete len:134 (-) Transcript_13009:517-918(-)
MQKYNHGNHHHPVQFNSVLHSSTNMPNYFLFWLSAPQGRPYEVLPQGGEAETELWLPSKFTCCGGGAGPAPAPAPMVGSPAAPAAAEGGPPPGLLEKREALLPVIWAAPSPWSWVWRRMGLVFIPPACQEAPS